MVDGLGVRKDYRPVVVVVSAVMGEGRIPVAAMAAAVAAAAVVHLQASRSMGNNPTTTVVVEHSARQRPLVDRNGDLSHRLEGCWGLVLGVVGRSVMDGDDGRRGLVSVEKGEGQIGGIGGTLTKKEGVVVGIGPAEGRRLIVVVVVFGRMGCDCEVEERLSDREDEIAVLAAVVDEGDIGRAWDH